MTLPVPSASTSAFEHRIENRYRPSPRGELMGELKGIVATVTGAGRKRGISRTAALTLVREGCMWWSQVPTGIRPHSHRMNRRWGE